MKKTKNKNKLIKRIVAILCAVVVVVVSCLGVSVPYYASHSVPSFDKASYFDFFGDYVVESISTYNSYVIAKVDNIYVLVVGIDVSMVSDAIYISGSSRQAKHAYAFYSDGSSWIKVSDGTGTYLYNAVSSSANKVGIDYSGSYELLYTSKDIKKNTGEVVYNQGWQELQFEYNSSLGYLQNVRMHTVFDDVPLGETTGEKWTSRWYYDQYSTTGIDLTSGDYMINYYQERWIVKGYGADDVIEKSDRYLLGTYIVQNGYIETYSEDIESTLQGQGYEEPSMLDLLWNKFITTHYYFQIVDAKNNQVGGVLHIYLTDDNGKFGVEHIGETLDNEGNYDDSGYKDFIDEDKITSDDVEGGFAELESGSSVDIGTIDGVDEFSYALESIALEINNVSNAMQQVLYMLPPWILTVLSVSFAMMVTLVVLAFIRG